MSYTRFSENLHFIMSHPEAVARQMTKLDDKIDRQADTIDRLRALLKEVDDWVRELEPFADADHEPVTVFKKVRAALQETSE